MTSSGMRSRCTRRGSILAALGVFVALTAGCGGGNGSNTKATASGRPQLRPVGWPALHDLWIGQIETDGERTWVLTLVPGPNGGNLFSLDAATLTVKEVPVGERLDQIVAGDGQLWAIADGRRLLSIDPSTQKIRSRALSVPCGVLSDPAGVLALDKLWLSCDGRVSAYSAGGGSERVSSPKTARLLASTDGIWAVTSGWLVGIGGVASGRRIAVPAKYEPRLWQSNGDEAWAVDLSAENKALIRVNLDSGAIAQFPLVTEGDQIDQYAISSEDIWVALREKPVILRFARARPARPLGQIELKGHANSSDFQVFLSAGPSYVWAEVFGNRDTKLFLGRP